MTESQLMRLIQLRASELGARLFRNNVGFCRGTKVRYGVCNPGGSDLIGWFRGRFLAVEVKAGTATTKAQADFLKAVIQAGGIGIVAHSIDDVELALSANK